MHKGHRDRKRKQALEGGFEHFAYHEILEMLLYYSVPRIDTNPIAHNLIDRFGRFDKVFDAEFSELCEVDQVGEKTAFLLKLIPEVIRRYDMNKIKQNINIGLFDDLVSYVKSLFVGKKYEQFYCICVSTGKNIVSTRLMMTGFADCMDIPVQKIVKEALDRGVSEIIVAHNHPYGSAYLSKDDVRYTENLASVLNSLDIRLLDHFVVAEDKWSSYYSM